MSGFSRQAYRIVTAIHLFVDHWLYQLRLTLGMGTNAPIIVVPYLSYGRSDYIYMQGRVLKEKRIENTVEGNTWQTLRNNFNRAWSVEIRNAILEITVGENSFLVKTDKEGYYKLDSSLIIPLASEADLWHIAKVKLVSIPWRTIHFEIENRFIVPNQAQFGVISDIDDTILETRVNSVLKLKMIYLTFFKSAIKRNAFPGVASFFRTLQEQATGINPIFYVSKSPWNIADHLEAFFHLNHIPLGPLMLRDYGLPYQQRPPDYKGHKFENIVKILQTYPALQFMLIGDNSEKDLDLYLGIWAVFQHQVRCIYIHNVRKWTTEEKRKRLEHIPKEAPPVLILDNYAQAMEDAVRMGYVST